jgi:protein-disulfide isomerase
VTIVEFADFECPFCERASETMRQLREVYGPERLRLVWKNRPLPFHANGRPAAEAAAGVFALAGADAFWHFARLALAGQSELGENRYLEWAKAAGVSDLVAYRSGLHAHAWIADVDADAESAKELGVDGTPWFFVNGVALVGAQPVLAFTRLIDEAEAAARAKMAEGVSAERVYDVLSKANVAAKPPADPEGGADDANEVFRIPVGTSPTRGPASAPVTIVEFADYQCPFCRRVESTLRDLGAEYGDRLRLVFKNAPLPDHERAEPAAEAALEVRAEKGDAAFWMMHDDLFDHSNDLGDHALVRWAEKAGADGNRIFAAIGKRAHAAEIAADADLAEDFDVQGTPQFFINGRHLAGAQPKERFIAVIEQELKKARELIDGGTAPSAVYEARTKDGRGAVGPERKPLTNIPSGDPTRGDADAKVTIHEFADFQCPFCVQAEATVREVLRAYGARVRLVWHDLPLPVHPHARTAARAAREARLQGGEQAFWAIHDRLMKGDGLNRPDLDRDARALGLDMVKWNAAIDGDLHKEEIDADCDSARDLGLNGTPSFLVVARGSAAGYVIVGARSVPAFRRLVERALSEAK